MSLSSAEARTRLHVNVRARTQRMRACIYILPISMASPLQVLKTLIGSSAATVCSYFVFDSAFLLCAHLLLGACIARMTLGDAALAPRSDAAALTVVEAAARKQLVVVSRVNRAVRLALAACNGTAACWFAWVWAHAAPASVLRLAVEVVLVFCQVFLACHWALMAWHGHDGRARSSGVWNPDGKQWRAMPIGMLVDFRRANDAVRASVFQASVLLTVFVVFVAHYAVVQDLWPTVSTVNATTASLGA